jgi:hypothetical protein
MNSTLTTATNTAAPFPAFARGVLAFAGLAFILSETVFVDLSTIF